MGERLGSGIGAGGTRECRGACLRPVWRVSSLDHIEFACDLSASAGERWCDGSDAIALAR